jgi:hypothetical protein
MLILGILMFGGCGAWFVRLGATSSRGVVIEGLIHLGPGGARIFFAVLAALSFGMVAIAVLGAIRLMGGKLHVDIDDDSITLPGRPLRPRPHRFAFAEITGASQLQLGGQVVLTIQDAHAKSSITRSHLGRGEFDEIVATVARHVPPPRATLPVAKLR